MPMHGNDYTQSPDIHIRFKTNGSQAKRDLFDYIISRLDCDYPFAPEDIAKHRAVQPEECSVCHGWQWNMPTLEREEVQRLAHQVAAYKGLPGHFNLKIRKFDSVDECASPLVLGACAGANCEGLA